MLGVRAGSLLRASIVDSSAQVTTIDAEIDANGLRGAAWAAIKADCETCERNAFYGGTELWCGNHPPSLIITEYFKGMEWLDVFARDYGFSSPGDQAGDATIRSEGRGPMCP